MKIDGPHLVEVQVHMEHVVEKGKKEEMTTHWSEHKVKEIAAFRGDKIFWKREA